MNSTMQAPSQLNVPRGTGSQSAASKAKDASARKRSRQPRSTIPANATGTPGSMATHQERDPVMAAVKSPAELDYHAVVREVMCVQNKSGLGFRLVSNKSKNHVFALSCDKVRSLCGLDKFDSAGKLVPVSPEVEKAIRDALYSVWTAEMNNLIQYGGPLETSDLRLQWDAPVTKAVEVLDANGKQVERDGRKVYDLSARLSATARVTRAPKDISESILVVSLRTTAAKNRLKQMQDKPGKYDRSEVRAQHDLVTLHEWKLAELYKEKGKLERIAGGIAALDDLLLKGKLSQDEYATKRKEIETAA